MHIHVEMEIILFYQNNIKIDRYYIFKVIVKYM